MQARSHDRLVDRQPTDDTAGTVRQVESTSRALPSRFTSFELGNDPFAEFTKGALFAKRGSDHVRLSSFTQLRSTGWNLIPELSESTAAAERLDGYKMSLDGTRVKSIARAALPPPAKAGGIRAGRF